jgi:hypothetical protein
MAIIARWRRPTAQLDWPTDPPRCSGVETPTRRRMSIVLGTRLALAHRLVQADRLDDLVADAVHRAERRHRLLEDQRDLRPPDRPHLGPIGRQLDQIDHPPARPSRPTAGT